MIILGIIRHCFSAKPLKSCGRIRNLSSCCNSHHKAKQQKCQTLRSRNLVFPASVHKARTQHNIWITAILILLAQSIIKQWNIANIMLSICIHLNYVFVSSSHRILISKLDSTSISKIKHMSNKRMTSHLHKPICGIYGCIVHNKNICNV